MTIEQDIFTQLKKGQGETNVRLDRLMSELQRTNELLAKLVNAQPVSRY